MSRLLSFARLTVLVARPQLITLLMGFSFLGVVVARGDVAVRPALLAAAVVACYVVAAVAVNDVADVAVDRLNVPHDRRRPLAQGTAGEGQLAMAASAGGLLALVLAYVAAGAPGLLVVTGGLVLVVAYSLPPLSLSRRGAVAALALPSGYVAVPFVTGVLAAGGTLRRDELTLLGVLYVGFVGRIVLKDFRDVVGDRLLGKRTFLVRHGRGATCAVSAVCWVVVLAVVRLVAHPTVVLDVVYVVRVLLVLAILSVLALAAHPRVQTALISAVAVLGRGLVVALVLHLVVAARGLPNSTELALQTLVLASELATAWRMTGRGTIRTAKDHPPVAALARA